MCPQFRAPTRFTRFDAGLLWHTKLWDIAAGLLVAAEAGVVLSGPDAAPTPELTLAAAPALWREFFDVAAAAVPHPI
ncbi:MAG: suhB [Nocardioidaceae bacterium]|nr:suhB [Nocardioidaceae bacterium]